MAKLTYETKTCGRCGGSGSYSYCSMYGSTCFQCAGRKTVLSKAGVAAAAKVKEFIAANFSKSADEIVAGDRVVVSGYTKPLVALTSATLSGSYSIGTTTSRLADGTVETVTKKTPYLSVEFRIKRNGAIETLNMGYCSGQRVTLAVAGADWEKVVEFARTIKRGVTVVEDAAEVVR